MILPMLPEIIMESSSKQDDKEQLLELRHSLQLVCQDVDDRIRALEGSQIEAKRELAPMNQVVFENAKNKPQIAAPMETRMVMEATAPSVMSADLEQTTLEELNAALAKAFAQMAGRMLW
jgi:hypothetical protein